MSILEKAENQFVCKDGKHLGVNNTTGRCPLCGQQVESPSNYGFGKMPKEIIDKAFSGKAALPSGMTSNGMAVILNSYDPDTIKSDKGFIFADIKSEPEYD